MSTTGKNINLPARRPVIRHPRNQHAAHASGEADGWNECLDAVEPVVLALRSENSALRAQIVELERQEPATNRIAKAIHYPECWDTAAYPTPEDALAEMAEAFRCTNDECAAPRPPVVQDDVVKDAGTLRAQRDQLLAACRRAVIVLAHAVQHDDGYGYLPAYEDLNAVIAAAMKGGAA